MIDVKKHLLDYFGALLIALMMYASNFIGIDLFNFGSHNFTVWFVLSVFCFASGWFLSRQAGWQYGGKILFAVIVATLVLSLFTITFFNEYFGTDKISVENIILYSLRNITLGAMGFFGMAIQFILQGKREILILQEKIKMMEEAKLDYDLKGSLIIKEAELKAKEIISNAELEAEKINITKQKTEDELKQLIKSEIELLKKYKEL
ncbi:MAG: DivIVA domain-containing protein [Ignavibacterium sp.]|nr:DivIVA domain-containing protein [Ignavibacterium sp.]MCX7610880.1 DivIVA domain-containing protein [Ignavibacterium sp.]MDW8374663.1 hypothetical protein [Ignavibacteriales bacterium]